MNIPSTLQHIAQKVEAAKSRTFIYVNFTKPIALPEDAPQIERVRYSINNENTEIWHFDDFDWVDVIEILENDPACTSYQTF